MTTPSITDTFGPVIDVLGKTLALTGESYQQLLTQPQSHYLCHEAGRTLRYVSDRYAQVLLAALAYTPDTNEDDENWGDEDETPREEEWGD